MDPKTFSDYSKKYGSSFLLWCAVFFLYNELSSYKYKVINIEEKLYGCLKEAAYKNANTQSQSKRKEVVQTYFIKPEDELKRKMECKNA